MEARLLEIEEKITKLNEEISSLSSQFYKNNFSASQTFNKDSVFTSRLKVPVFDSAPTVAEISDIMSIGGILYVCTTASTDGVGAVWTVVGSQV